MNKNQNGFIFVISLIALSILILFNIILNYDLKLREIELKEKRAAYELQWKMDLAKIIERMKQNEN